MQDRAQPLLPEYRLNITTLPARGHRLHLVATGQELQAMAADCNVEAISEFEAHLEIKTWHKKGLTVSGTIKARYRQLCVVTLEPIEQTMDHEFSVKLVPADSKLARPDLLPDGELVIDFESEDLPDVFDGNEIDVWAIILEQFNLELDPYPRLPGAQLSEADAPEASSASKSPFAVLESLKNRKN